MKKMTILLAAMLTLSLASAQNTQDKTIPAIVKTTFQKNYPAAKKIKWEKENGNYEAEFELKGTGYSVVFDTLGNIMETEMEISVDSLPADAKAYVAKNHSGQKIKEVEKITDAKGTVTYKAEIKGKELIFDSNGNFIREETEQDHD